ncbi:SLAIN motif-containing protein-like [Periophthalmus magnuspinnatus]|uniref:SLAIN motif-containing protein-like n=1 Tax=Periophthalmus magnuspinnatus TaxID=409849 RepID=UPI002436B1AF|nr:SLAIN motif-containing protein-like [Periophthalmus magnuspinnatus]
MSLDSTYKLQNITDVYDVARIQEASLRQENVYTLRRSKSPLTLPLCSYTTNILTHRNRTEAPFSISSVPVNQSARMNNEKNCLSPKVTRLHEYKMLKRAQNQGVSSRSRSPMRTSLRSLQAVRSSRSLDIDHYNLDQILHVRPGASSARTDSSYRSASHSAHHMEPVQPTAIKRCQRSHSLSPCRIPHPSISSAESFCSSQKRGAAWVRSGRQLQR